MKPDLKIILSKIIPASKKIIRLTNLGGNLLDDIKKIKSDVRDLEYGILRASNYFEEKGKEKNILEFLEHDIRSDQNFKDFMNKDERLDKALKKASRLGNSREDIIEIKNEISECYHGLLGLSSRLTEESYSFSLSKNESGRAAYAAVINFNDNIFNYQKNIKAECENVHAARSQEREI